MENQNQSSNDYLESLKQQLNDYQKEVKNTGSRKSKEEILAKYFVPRDDIETFRILPPPAGKKPIQEAFFHVMDLNVPNGKKNKWRAIYCPAHNDPMVQKKDGEGNPITDQNGKPVLIPAPCPLCEKAKQILKKQDQSLIGKKKEDLEPHQVEQWEKNLEIFKDANQWQARKYYIIRGIDRGKTKDGVKFWRFKKNFKNQGPLDKLLPVLNSYIDAFNVAYFDKNKGCDLRINMVDSQNGKTKGRTISAIIAQQPSKLHEDEIIAKQWIDDPTTWRDVFKPKSAPEITPLQFLELLAEGNDPYWDDSDANNKHWVFPNHPELEAKANQRSRNLDSDNKDYSNFEQASDIANDGVTIGNVTQSDVGNYENSNDPKAVDVMSGLEDNTNTSDQQNDNSSVDNSNERSFDESVVDSQEDGEEDKEYDDLPF